MKVLIVEDDKASADILKKGLEAQTHTVEVSPDGADGLFMAKSYEYDVIILDYSLPKKDGLIVCSEIRSAGKNTPIIFLSMTDDVSVKVSAFEKGADDYMIKPFSLEELHARIKALNKRAPEIKSSVFTVADLIMDTSRNTISRKGVKINLTRKEISLLEYMMKNSGKMLSRAMIMEHVWTADSNPFSNTVEAHIGSLRRKINIAKSKDLIANFMGRGYIMDTPENLAKM